MKTLLYSLSIYLLVSNSIFANSNTLKINFLNLKDCTIPVAVNALSMSTNLKVVCTVKTFDKNVNLLIRDVDALDALKLMCKTSGLVYRYDVKNHYYTVMTLDEYRENTTVDGREQTKLFKVEPANLDLIAQTIESLYSSQVVLTQNDDITDFSASSSQSNSSENNQQIFSNSESSDFNGSSNHGGNGFSHTQNQASLQSRFSSSNAFALEDSKQLEKRDIIDRFFGGNAGPPIYVTTNREHNMLILKSADLNAIEEIERLIQKMDEPMPQVILEMKILSLDIGNDERIGFDYTFYDGNTENNRQDPQGQPVSVLGFQDNLSIGQGVAEAGNTLAFSYINENLMARLQMKANENQADVIATPILVAANNREAKIEVGKERIITTGASVNTDSALGDGQNVSNTTISYDTQVRTIGTTLTIIPRINKDRTVTLYVEQENSTLVLQGNTLLVDGTTVKVDAVDTAKMDATVVAKDRYTIAVGGLIQSERMDVADKVPFLSDLPLLGKAFSRNEKRIKKTELILLIRPYIIDGAVAADHATKSLIERLSSHHYVNRGDQVIDQQNSMLQDYINEVPINEVSVVDAEAKAVLEQLSSKNHIHQGGQAVDEKNKKLQKYLDDLLENGAELPSSYLLDNSPIEDALKRN